MGDTWPFGDLPRGVFGCVTADPPWHFKSNSAAKPGRNAMRHYGCMSLGDIARLPVEDLLTRDAVLFLWITGPFLAIGAHLPIMKAWGFKPSGMGFTWIKMNPKASTLFFLSTDIATGPGRTTRKNAEFCLIGKRGRSLRKSASVHEIIIDNRREHSRKPEQFRDRVEQYVGPDVKIVELFARSTRPDWASWGNEATKFDGVAA